jgi:pimeloyl-ACP methyl ester carboxylesterase
MSANPAKPSIFWTLTEPFRAAGEYVTLQAVNGMGLLDSRAPRGDDHAVIALPALMAHDKVDAALIAFLRRLGYVAHDSSIGWNTGVKDRVFNDAETRLLEVFAEQGGRRVSLIGHSLGGICAVYLAYRHPEKIRQVITLGSPFGTAQNRGGVPAPIMALYNAVSENHEAYARLLLRAMKKGPPQAPVTSVFSQSDGVVSAGSSINPWSGAKTENIAIPGSHVGMAFNPLAFLVIADRLAQAEDAWRPFDHAHYPDIAWLMKAQGAAIPGKKLAVG